MAVHDTQMQAFIYAEAEKIKGVSFPVHAGKLERLLVRKVHCKKLHPNPYDEFCFPEIGPNAGIVAHYEHAFRLNKEDPDSFRFLDTHAGEPLDVQKIHPDGYMILNGHHRWIAAVRAGITRMPVRIVNLTQEKDIRKMLDNSSHTRRITLDLDEVVFTPCGDGKTEKPLRFPFNRFYREPLRLGIPALFSFIASRGYDIWLYSSGYASADHYNELLKLYHTRVTGIVTACARKTSPHSKTREELEKLIAVKYARTIHISNEQLVCIDSAARDFRDFPLNDTSSWSAEVMEIIKKIDQ